MLGVSEDAFCSRVSAYAFGFTHFETTFGLGLRKLRRSILASTPAVRNTVRQLSDFAQRFFQHRITVGRVLETNSGGRGQQSYTGQAGDAWREGGSLKVTRLELGHKPNEREVAGVAGGHNVSVGWEIFSTTVRLRRESSGCGRPAFAPLVALKAVAGEKCRAGEDGLDFFGTELTEVGVAHRRAPRPSGRLVVRIADNLNVYPGLSANKGLRHRLDLGLRTDFQGDRHGQITPT